MATCTCIRRRPTARTISRRWRGGQARRDCEYIAITDHSQALAMAGGLDEHRALAHAATIREIGRRLDGIGLLAGIECDIRPDGTMDLADDCLPSWTWSLPQCTRDSARNRPPSRNATCARSKIRGWTSSVIRPGVCLLKREPLQFDLDAVVAAAQPRSGDRDQLPDRSSRRRRGVARHALEKGARLVISSDAHSVNAFATLDFGVRVARRAWATAAEVLNTRPAAELRSQLRRRRSASLAS